MNRQQSGSSQNNPGSPPTGLVSPTSSSAPLPTAPLQSTAISAAGPPPPSVPSSVPISVAAAAAAALQGPSPNSVRYSKAITTVGQASYRQSAPAAAVSQVSPMIDND